MSDSRRAMSTWIGTLARGGILRDEHEEAGVTVAAYVVGEEELGKLRAWMKEQPAETIAEIQRGAVEVCIWMTHADRTVDPEETHLLRQIVLATALDDDGKDALVAATHDPPSLDGIETRLGHPVLRELMLALAWELANADGRIEKAEKQFHAGLAKRLGVSEARATELRDAVTARISLPPG